jgi:hypothetical protein
LAVGCRSSSKQKKKVMAIVAALVSPTASPLGLAGRRQHRRYWRVAKASSSAAAAGVDLKALESAIDKVKHDSYVTSSSPHFRTCRKAI